MSIPAKESANKAFFELYSPMARWLQEIAGRQIEIQVTNDSEKSFIVLGSLHKFCTSSEDLVRTFTLSSLCREAVFIVAQKKEVKTFGKIWRDESGEYRQEWCQICLIGYVQTYISHSFSSQFNRGSLYFENLECAFLFHYDYLD